MRIKGQTVSVGDIITVKVDAVVTDISAGGHSARIVARGVQLPMWVSESSVEILSHQQVVYEPQVGDVITWGDGFQEYEVKAIDGDHLWLRHSSGNGGRMSTRLSHIRTYGAKKVR